ncbi:MAG: M24 family metallopeptidase [Erysipelotrichaceae bacterium]|nr:M24 family metallopeptidase [Erysipelotrichaceae bacterium]
MIKQEFINRREKLEQIMEDNSVVILFSGLPARSSADAEYSPFHSNRNFYYFTGIDQKNSILIIIKADQVITTYLFIDEYDAFKEKWFGKTLKQEEASAISGIDDILLRSTFSAKLSQILIKDNNMYGQFETVYLDEDTPGLIDENNSLASFKANIINEYNLKVINIFDEITKLRMVKSPREISYIREAIQMTNHGLNYMLGQLKPGMYEYQARALFEFDLDYTYKAEVAFDTIAASGANGVILHYPQLSSKMEDGDLLMVDLGAKSNHYCADISRTYPVNGKFSKEQAKIYSIVLECNKAVIDYIKPGITLHELQAFTVSYFEKALLKAKLIKSKEEVRDVYYHSVSHHLGLDTHDVSLRNLPLEPGNVITVEPGLYFKKLNIGIRIEDDVLVTDNGSENLSSAIIKEISDIEKLLAKRR